MGPVDSIEQKETMQYKQLVHFSDVHIHKGDSLSARYDEYVISIDRFLRFLATQNPHSILVVLTGDIFHDKSEMGPSAHLLATRLFSGMARYRAIVIKGNHDYRQDQPTEPDLVKPFLSEYSENIEYLDETGSYNIGNIEVNVVAIQDTLKAGAGSGIASSLPDFPQANRGEDGITHHIAVFHGSVGGAKLQNGMEVEDRNNYPLAWFGDQDMILLGDIHVQQVSRAKAESSTSEFTSKEVKDVYKTGSYSLDTTKNPWGYAGSMIQQTYGEGLWGHGFNVWDLENNMIHTYHIRNDYGKVFISVNENNEMGIKFRLGRQVQFINLETVMKYGWFPKQISIRFPFNLRKDTDTATIQTSLERHGVIVRDTGFADEKVSDDVSSVSISAETKEMLRNDLTELNSVETWAKFLADNEVPNAEVVDWIKHPHTLNMPTSNMPDTIASAIVKRNDAITKLVKPYIESRTTLNPTRVFQLHYIEFDNLLCYGRGNFVNLDTHTKQICLINGNNGSGKSAFLEVLVLSLYGSPFPSRQNKSFSAAVINQQKNKHEAAFTNICFSIDGKRYWIHRTYEFGAKPRNLQQKNVRLMDEATSSTIHQNANIVDKWVEENVGSFSNFLLTTIMSQSNDSDFFGMTDKEQMAIIDSLLNLQVCKNFTDLLKEAQRGHKYVLDTLQSFEQGQQSSYRLALGMPDIQLDDLRFSVAVDIAELETKRLAAAEAAEAFAAIPVKAFSQSLSVYEMEAKQLADLEEPSEDYDEIKEQESQLRDRLAVLKSKRYQPPLLPVKTTRDFDSAEQRLQELRVSRQALPMNSRIYDSKAHDTWSQRRAAWFTVNPDVEAGDKTVRELEKELRQLRNEIISYEVNEDDYDEVSEKALNGLKKTHDQLTERLTNITSELNHRIKEEAKLRSQLTPDVLTQIKQYNVAAKKLKTLTGCETTVAAVDMLKKANELDGKADRLEEQKLELTTELEELGDIQFNKDCSACKSNRLPQRKSEVEKRLKAIAEELSDLSDELEEILESAEDGITLDQLNQQVAAWEKLNTEQMRKVLDIKAKQSELVTTINTLQVDSEKIKAEIEETDYENQNEANLYFAIKKSIQETEAAVECARYAHEDREWAAAKSTYELDMQIKDAEAETAAAYTSELRKQNETLSVITTSLKEFEAFKNAQIRLAEIDAIRKGFPHRQKYLELDSRIQELTKNISGKEAQLEQAEIMNKRMAEAKSQTEQLATFRVFIEGRLNLLARAEAAFATYSNWLYPNMVKPMLEEAVNALLAKIPLPRPIQLVVEWEEGAPNWYIRDGLTQPIYEKASGSQKFITSLAFRLAVSRMGSCNMINRQIFLDEGFTACDAETMSHIPELLRSLINSLDGLNTIYIVSHLEGLKSAAHNKITVQRGINGSKLMVGERVQIPAFKKTAVSAIGKDDDVIEPTSVPKKRGRPSTKKIVVAED